MIITSRKVLIAFSTLLAVLLFANACSKRPNDSPDPEDSAVELEKQVENIAGNARKAIDEAEAALKQSAEKIDESLESAGISD